MCKIPTSHNLSHNTAENRQIKHISTYDLRYTEAPLMCYFSISDTPLPNNPKAYTKGFEFEFCQWSDIHKITKRYSYTNAVFKDGYRKIDNITGFGNLLILDIDDHYDINAVRETLKGVQSLIVTTRSHTKEKHKFRVIIQTDKCLHVDLSKELYKEILKVTAEHICGLEPKKIDNACFGMDRQYAPNPKQDHRYIKGGVVQLEHVINFARDNLKTTLAKVQPITKQKYQQVKNSSNSPYKQKRDYIREHLSAGFMIEILGEKGLIIHNDGKVTIPGKKTKALSIDLKTGLLRDFANDVSYDPVSILYDVYHEGTLSDITDKIYQRLGGECV